MWNGVMPFATSTNDPAALFEQPAGRRRRGSLPLVVEVRRACTPVTNDKTATNELTAVPRRLVRPHALPSFN
jgi:hypothetical protein